MTLVMYNRPKYADTRVPGVDIDAIARNYQQVTRAAGGFYSATFEVSGQDVSRQELIDFFNTWIGRVVKNHIYGLVAWEGIVYKLSLILGGYEYLISLENEWFHNRVKTTYGAANVEDVQQGALSYEVLFTNVDSEQGNLAYIRPAEDTEQGNLAYLTNAFQDDGQDFEDYETTDGEAAYIIVIVNSDSTKTWGYLGGPAYTTTNTDDSIPVYQDYTLETAGFNGADPTSKTPSTYEVCSTVAQFQDDGQDFDEWNSITQATHYINITNANTTHTKGYLGEDFTTTNPNDSINVYHDINLSSPGWNSHEPVGQNPSSYAVQSVFVCFQDASQDFSDWATSSGDAAYKIEVVNSDDTVSWGYCGAAKDIDGTNDGIVIYTDQARTTQGWNGESVAGKTPSSYHIIAMTYWTRATLTDENDTDSQDEYGRQEYLLSMPAADATISGAARDRHLAEYAWPRARLAGRVEDEDGLVVTCMGFWSTLFWRFVNYSLKDAASDLISTLAGLSEFVTAGRIASNSMEVMLNNYPMPQKIGDLITHVTGLGDTGGNLWQVGVYEDRKLIYEQMPTTYEYIAQNTDVLDLQRQEVIPELFTPGILIRHPSLTVWQPAGDMSQWNADGIAYVDQVEWNRDRGELRMSLADMNGQAISGMLARSAAGVIKPGDYTINTWRRLVGRIWEGI